MTRSRIFAIALLAAALSIPAIPAGASDTAGAWIDEGNTTETLPRGPISFSVVVYDIVFPVVGDNSYTDTFGACRGSGCSRRHEGIDILADKMVPVVAVADGTVGWMHDDRGGDCCAFALDHDDGWESYYIHLNNDTPGTDDGQGWGFAPGVYPGAHVEAGQMIAWVGDSGNAEGTVSHLHYELHKPDRTVVNPFPSLEAATRVDAPTIIDGPRACDFNGDGFGDLAVGAPGEDLGKGTKPDAGAVTVLFGTAAGLDATDAVVIKQSTPGVGSAAEADDRFGTATACGDLNGDSYADLVIGSPGEDFGAKVDVGAINVLYGSDNGLVAGDNDLWHQGKPGVASDNGAGDLFGASLAVADYDADGFDDLVVGAPGETIAGKAGAGRLTVFYGSPVGVTSLSAGFSEAGAAMPGAVEADDRFAAALAAGDFDGDGTADVAVGLPGENTSGGADVGAVVILYGSGSGLSPTGVQRFKQGAAGVAGAPAAGEEFGFALAAGDADGDLIDDLAVGAPGDTVSGAPVGGVNFLYGSEGGIDGARGLVLHVGASGLPGTAAAGDRFGAAVTMGDFNLDGHRDLAVGVPGADASAGAAIVVPSLWDGLVTTDAAIWSQASAGVSGAAAPNDQFGFWLGTGAFDALGYSSLVVGVPFEDKGLNLDSGAVHVLRGGAAGLTAEGDQLWRQSSPGVPGSESAGDGWGHVLRAGV